MPVFEPSNRDGEGDDGYVLDLQTAVKDGVFGCDAAGANVVSSGTAVGSGEKVDLQRMISELSLPQIPSLFICPISLEPMEDPVTLCTGQTYDRSNILTWLSHGHVTCPTTMQDLWDHSLTPNTTLRHLIQTWFSHRYFFSNKSSDDFHGRASETLQTLNRVKGRARVKALRELRRLVVAHAAARRAVVESGGVGSISGLLGPFTSHAVGSEAVAILAELDLGPADWRALTEPAKLSVLVDILNEGSPETKAGCARLIEALLGSGGSKFVPSHGLVVGLIRLVRTGNSALPGLRLLKTICSQAAVPGLLVQIGAVPGLVELLPGLGQECLEPALSVLEAVSGVPEGRLAMKECPATIPNTVRLLMRVSERSTELVLSILWGVFGVAPEECSAAAAVAGLPAKLLLVMQSGFGLVLKQRSAELLKLCTLNYTDTLFMSKCNLATTIQ